MVNLAYTCAFSTLMLMNSQFCRILKINFVIFKDTAFNLSNHQLMQLLLTHQHAKKSRQADRQTDRQTNGFSAVCNR